MSTEEQLDREELMALAEQSLNNEDSEAAMAYLKRALHLDAEDVMALYVLATIHASLGMHERAVEEIAQVLEMEPEFHAARFQLGLIFLAHGDEEGLLHNWSRFTELPHDDTFYLFRRGIEHYFNDRQDLAVHDLTQSIEQNTAYPSIIEDMENIRNEIAAGDTDEPG